MKKVKPYPETHQRGSLIVDSNFPTNSADCDFGVQIAEDGRVWICLDGVSLMRFQPTRKENKDDRNKASL